MRLHTRICLIDSLCGILWNYCVEFVWDQHQIVMAPMWVYTLNIDVWSFIKICSKEESRPTNNTDSERLIATNYQRLLFIYNLFSFSASSSSSSESGDTDTSSSEDEFIGHKLKGQNVLATPAVRRIAMENKVDKIKSWTIQFFGVLIVFVVTYKFKSSRKKWLTIKTPCNHIDVKNLV